MSPATVVVAGATGHLGGRIARALLARGASVRALVRHDADDAARDQLTALGIDAATADARDVTSVAAACAEAACVVSALNGLSDVILDRQSVLIDAAVRAGVPRFIPSDFSADYTKTPPGRNRNFDLRREYMGRADRAPIEVTSILNGAFMELLDGDMPLIQSRNRRVLFWGDADQELDFTTKDDVAAYTAAAAMDAATPRILRIAGDTLSVKDIARALSETTGSNYRPLRAGSIASMSALIGVTKRLAPSDGAVFPAWQGMQYTRDMFDGRVRLDPLDNNRYPDLPWTSVRARFADNPAFAVARTPTPGVTTRTQFGTPSTDRHRLSVSTVRDRRTRPNGCPSASQEARLTPAATPTPAMRRFHPHRSLGRPVYTRRSEIRFDEDLTHHFKLFSAAAKCAQERRGCRPLGCAYKWRPPPETVRTRPTSSPNRGPRGRSVFSHRSRGSICCLPPRVATSRS